MRIAQVLGPYRPDRGGIARVVESFKLGLVRRGHDVHIVSAIDSPTPSIKDAKVIEERPRLRPSLISQVRRLDADVVHVHCYSSWLPANISLLRAVGVKVVFTPHYHPRGAHPRWKREAFDLVIGNSVMRAANRVHALTEGEAETLVERFRLDRRRITVIPNPLPPVFRAGGLEGPGETNKGARKVLFVGRIDSQKGLEHLLRAFKNIEEESRFPEVTLEIIGDDSDPYRETLGKLMADLRLRRTTLVGPIDDSQLIAKYREACVLVLPSVYEAFGMVIVEAMAFGCPVIATRAGGVPWLVHEGHNGLLVDYGDVAALTAALARILEDKELRERMSNAAREAAGQYSLDRVAARLEGLYRRTIDG